MKIIKLTAFLLIYCITVSYAEITYKINLNERKTDQVEVQCNVSGIEKDSCDFIFPKTVPGTYATLDYGRYILNFKAYDKNEKELKLKKVNVNVYRIFNTKNLSTIKYTCTSSWKDGGKKKIFEPAGTNIQNNNIVLNTPGFFGFIPDFINSKTAVEMTIPNGMYSLTSAENTIENGIQKIKYKSYHELVDSPVLVCMPDTASFMVGGCRVTISCFHEGGKQYAIKLREKVKPAMEGIEKFLGQLPVKNYSYLVYLKDYSNLNIDFESGKIGLGKAIKLISKLNGKGFGALEHNLSSLYYLPDFGSEKFVVNMFESTAIHEFMHIITPLNLHAEQIGNFDYINPSMSEHLWLYEGCTEYFAGIIRAKNNLMNKTEYLNETLAEEKIKTGERFPFSKMSFTEMSKNVLNEPYKKEYGQVYQRGAALAALLDLEIMKQTKGEKQLIDVIKTLISKYGIDKSFKDENLFKEFSEACGCNLNDFFSGYVSGKDSIPYQKILNYAGVDFINGQEKEIPLALYEMNGFKKKAGISISINNEITVKKPGDASKFGIRKGDRVSMKAMNLARLDENGRYKKAGEEVVVKVKRKGQVIEIKYPLTIEKRKLNYQCINMFEKTPEQQKVFEKWFNN